MKRIKKSFNKLRSPNEERPTSHEPEPSTSSKPQPKSSSPLSSCILELCKGCDKLFKSKVQSFLKANGEEWLRNKETRDYLRKYLEKHEGGGFSKSDAEEYLELYELCRAVLQDQKKIVELESEIKGLLFDEDWEAQLRQAVVTGNINEFLNNVMRECAIRLEKTEDYEMMRKDLKDKI